MSKRHADVEEKGHASRHRRGPRSRSARPRRALPVLGTTSRSGGRWLRPCCRSSLVEASIALTNAAVALSSCALSRAKPGPPRRGPRDAPSGPAALDVVEKCLGCGGLA
eukprot:3062754-Prymnesium_polylepis.1